jgi:hypothetical protein
MSFLVEESPILLDKTKDPKFSHYADSVSVTEGYITGKAVVAICGKVFVPSRDPKKFPICPICKELAEALFLGEE